MLSRQQQWMMRENASYPLKFCTDIPDKNDAVRDIQLNARTSERELQARIIYRMVIVEGCCTMARSSSLGAKCSLVDTKV